MKNKGAMSLEYILVIVVVVLVCLGGMKLFGGQVGNTINGSTDAVNSATESIFSNFNGSGGSSGGGGAETPQDETKYISLSEKRSIIIEADGAGTEAAWRASQVANNGYTKPLSVSTTNEDVFYWGNHFRYDAGYWSPQEGDNVEVINATSLANDNFAAQDGQRNVWFDWSKVSAGDRITLLEMDGSTDTIIIID